MLAELSPVPAITATGSHLVITFSVILLFGPAQKQHGSLLIPSRQWRSPHYALPDLMCHFVRWRRRRLRWCLAESWNVGKDSFTSYTCVSRQI
jgi:hypothetical protein